MYRRCPHCGGTNVRRSGRLESEAHGYHFHSPYRCRDCDKRFWVVSRKTLVGAVAGGAMFVIIVFLWSGVGVMSRHENASPRSAAPGASLESRMDVGAAQSDLQTLGNDWPRQYGDTRLDGSTARVSQ